jgi:hypothetical protein
VVVCHFWCSEDVLTKRLGEIEDGANWKRKGIIEGDCCKSIFAHTREHEKSKDSTFMESNRRRLDNVTEERRQRRSKKYDWSFLVKKSIQYKG